MRIALPSVSDGMWPILRPRLPRPVRAFAERVGVWLQLNQAALTQALVLVAVLRVALGLVGYLAVSFLPENRIGIVRHPSPNLWLDMWARWDSIHYLNIVENGYSAGSEDLAFFPLLPLLIRGVLGIAHGDTILAGLLVSTVSLAVGLFYLFQLVKLEFGAELAARTSLYVAVAPMAFFFFSIYTESLFLALSVGALYHARRSQWVAAGALGALACLTRPPGFLLLVPLLYEAVRQFRGDWRTGVYAFANSLALPTFLAGRLTFFYYLTGDPLAFMNIEFNGPWHRKIDWPWNTLWEGFQSIQATTLDKFDRTQFTVDLGAAVLLVIAAVIGLHFLPRYLSIYLAASVAFLLVSRTDHQVLFSMPRFAMVEFPAFILLAMAGRNQRVHQAILFTSVLLLGLYTSLFVSWYWIA